jgi:uncharacterized membrane protein YidH (DUF202 family)
MPRLQPARAGRQLLARRRPPAGPPGPALRRPEPGAAAERTLLAWVRTGLVFGGCALLLARLVQPRHPLAALVAALLGLAAAAALAGRAGDRYRSGAREPAPGLLLALTAAVLAVGAAALVAVYVR